MNGSVLQMQSRAIDQPESRIQTYHTSGRTKDTARTNRFGGDIQQVGDTRLHHSVSVKERWKGETEGAVLHAGQSGVAIHIRHRSVGLVYVGAEPSLADRCRCGGGRRRGVRIVRRCEIRICANNIAADGGGDSALGKEGKPPVTTATATATAVRTTGGTFV